jgi:glycosyltransferase involved in cell wall biosynthesis
MGRRVLMMVTNGFRPDPRVAKEAEALASEGYDVTVLAWDRENKFPDRSDYKGASIERVRTGWAGSMLTFALFYPLFFARGLLRALRKDVDIVHSHDFDTLPLGFLVSWFKRVPLVFDAHENYAQMIAIDLPGWIPRLVERMEGALTRRAAVVITVSEVHAAHMRPNARNGVVLVENCIDIPRDIPLPKFENRDLVLLYVGTLEPMRYIEESIAVSKGIDHCVYRIAGWGRLEDVVKKEADGKKVQFLGFLQHPVMLREMASCDVVVCLLDPSNKNYVGNSPTKIYEAMAVGVPVLTSGGTTSGDLVSKTGCGLVIDWSEEEFRKAIEEFRDPRKRREWGQAGRAAAEREYNWPNMKARLLKAYREALGQPSKSQ